MFRPLVTFFNTLFDHINNMLNLGGTEGQQNNNEENPVQDNNTSIQKPKSTRPLPLSNGETQLTISLDDIEKAHISSGGSRNEEKQLLPDLYFVPNQALFITQAKSDTLEQFFKTDAGMRLRKTYGLEENSGCDVILDVPLNENNSNENIAIRSFNYEGEMASMFTDLKASVIRFNEETESDLLLIPVPNFILGSNQWQVGGTPWQVGGTPWQVGGTPWQVGGTGAGSGRSPHPPMPHESEMGPWDQWAFRQAPEGIDLYHYFNDPKEATRTVDNLAGDGVDLFIFDTSPLHKKVGNKTVEILGRDLHIYQPNLTIEIKEQHKFVAEHGYFIAGLVRMIAPNTNLNLVRVLNQDGVGDMLSLVVVIKDVLDTLKKANKTQGAVFNFSLSLVTELETAAEKQGVSLTLEEKIAFEAQLPREYHSLLNEDPMAKALEMVLADANKAGVSIICAAGNESDITHKDITHKKDPHNYPAGSPASLPFTLAVGSSNSDGDRSCFSNRDESKRDGDGVHAPSGNGTKEKGGRFPTDDDPFTDCEYPYAEPDKIAALSQAQKDAIKNPSKNGGYDDMNGVTSMLYNNGGDKTIGHWLGTSFSAPIVSGIAALVISDRKARGKQITPARIKGVLLKAQDPHTGIIKVSNLSF